MINDLIDKIKNRRREKFRKTLEVSEDAPTNSASAGHVAGIGVGPHGEPGRGGPMLRRKKFAGMTVFEVSSDVFYQARFHKRKGAHWKKYLNEDDCFKEIRDFANSNPNEAIIFQNESTGEMCYARYGKAR